MNVCMYGIDTKRVSLRPLHHCCESTSRLNSLLKVPRSTTATQSNDVVGKVKGKLRKLNSRAGHFFAT